MICPNCGNNNNEGVKYCVKCGTQLVSVEPVVPTAAPAPVTEPVVEAPVVEQPVVEQPVPATPTESVVETPPVEQVQPIPSPVQPVVDNPQAANPGYVQPTGVPSQPQPQVLVQPNTQPMPQPMNNPTPVYNNNSGVVGQPKKSKTPIIVIGIIVAIVVLAIVGSIIGKKVKSTGDKIVDETFKSTDLILIEENNKYGYINLDGKKVVEPKYKYASSFYGKYAIVADEKGYHLIDKKGKVKMDLESSNGFKYESKYDIWIIQGTLYNGDLKRISGLKDNVDYEEKGYSDYTSENERGIMNYKGKKTYKSPEPSKYFGIVDIGSELVGKDKYNNYCSVTIDNSKYAIVNCETGKIIYDYTTNYISHSSSKATVFTIKTDNSYKYLETIVISHDKIVFNDKNDKYRYYDRGSYLEISNNDDYNDIQYLDYKSGKIVKERPSKDDDVSELTENWETVTGLKKFSCSDGYGIIKDKDIKVECNWKRIDYPGATLAKYLKSKGKVYAFAEKDDKTYLINANNGKVIEEFNTTSINDSDSSIFINYTDKDTKKVVVYNILTDKKIELAENTSISKESDYFIATTSDNMKHYYNGKFKEFYSTKK